MSKFKIKIISAVIFFIFISVCIMISNSSYINKIFFKSQNSIDNPIINFWVDEEINLSDVNSKTIFDDIKFKINNYNENNINSAKMNYCIQIIDGLDDEYLEYIIINNNTNEEIKVVNRKTDYIELAINEKEDIEYILKINNNLPNNIIETNIKIKVKIIAIQEK